MLLPLIATVVLLIWLGLCLAHAFFWRIDRVPVPPPPPAWPGILVVIPARNEEEGIGETLRSLWEQSYRGELRIVLVDDHSDDATAAVARQMAGELGHLNDLQVVAANVLPPGWAGKVWAMQQGLDAGIDADDPPHYVLFSDADIAHGPDALRELVCRAEAGPCDLVSYMVRLHCGAVAERLMIPAFVFFFRMLYPFRRVNTAAHPLAGAAGGTMLVRLSALDRIGRMESIAGELIDDCALARQIKRGGHRLWLGLSDTSSSTRRYERLSEILHMIARTAYTQLRYSPLQLAGCVVGLALIFLAPPLLLLSGKGIEVACGGLSWLLMSLIYLPTVRYYRQSPLWAPLLPLTTLLYLAATLLSAWRHYRGQGGQWKGRSRTIT